MAPLSFTDNELMSSLLLTMHYFLRLYIYCLQSFNLKLVVNILKSTFMSKIEKSLSVDEEISIDNYAKDGGPVEV